MIEDNVNREKTHFQAAISVYMKSGGILKEDKDGIFKKVFGERLFEKQKQPFMGMKTPSSGYRSVNQGSRKTNFKPFSSQEGLNTKEEFDEPEAFIDRDRNGGLDKEGAKQIKQEQLKELRKLTEEERKERKMTSMLLKEQHKWREEMDN